MTNEYYIALTGGLYGYWGVGCTPTEALENVPMGMGSKKSKKTVFTIERFFSQKPFAPTDRAAEDNEADAWVGKDGSINWLRCEREDDFDKGTYNELMSKHTNPQEK